VAAEDFNISLGLDTSSADKELATFVANARKQARAVRLELRKELGSIKLPKLKIDSDISSALKGVDELNKKIDRLKKSTAKDLLGLKGIDGRLSTLKTSLEQLTKVGSKSPASTAALVEVKSEIKKLEAQKKKIADNTSSQLVELKNAQEELTKENSNPKVIAAMEARKKAIKSHNDAVAKSYEKVNSLAKQIEELERGPEVVKAMKGQVAGLKEMRARASKMGADARKELADVKAAFAAGKADKSKVDAATKKVKTLHDYVLWVSDEIETLSDAGPRTRGLKGITKKMGVKPAYGGDSGVRGDVPSVRSTSPINSKDLQAIAAAGQKIAKASIDIGIARKVASAAQTRPNKQTTGGVAPNLLIAALHEVAPTKVTAEVAGRASRGEGGIGVILRDTKADITQALEELEQAERENSDSNSEVVSSLSDLQASMVDLGDQMGDGSKQKRTGGKISAAEAAIQSEMVRGGGAEATGSIVTASEDLARNLRDANNHTSELVELFSAGDDQRKPGGVSDRRGGVFTIENENAIGMMDDAVLNFATVTADEFEKAVEIALRAAEYLNAATKRGGSAELKFSGAPVLSNRTNQGMYRSSESRAIGAQREGRDAELDSREEDSQKGTLPLVPIGLSEQDRQIEAAIDRGFQKFLQQYLKLESKPSVGVKDILGPLGTYANASPDSEAGKIIAALREAGKVTPTDRNFIEIDKAIGASSPFATLIKTLIAKVTAGVDNPVVESLGMTGDSAMFQYQALSNNDTAKAMSEIGEIQERFVSMVHYLAILYDKAGLGVKVGITRGNYQDVADSSTLGTQADPYMDSFLRLFNATQNPGPKEIPALAPDGQRLKDAEGNLISRDIASPLNGFVEKLTPFTRVLQDLAKTFADIYKIPMANNLGKTAKFNDLGLPDPEGKEKTYGQAFTENRNGFIRDMLKASAPKVPAGGPKDATDKAGGAEIPIDAIENILERLASISEQYYGGPAAMIGTMDAGDYLQNNPLHGQPVGLTNQLIEQMVKIFTTSRQSQQQRLIGMGISTGGAQPAAEDAVRAKYGETVNGLTAGLAPGIGKAEKAGADTAIAFIDGYEGKMEIESPSKRMRRSGDDTIAGLEEGLFEGVARLDKAGRELADSFHTGWSEKARVDAAELIQQLEKEGTDAAKARIQKGLAMMRSAPPARAQSDLPSMRTEAERKRLAETGAAAFAAKGGSKPAPGFVLSSQEEIQRRNAANLAQLDVIRAKGEEILVALDIESTGGRNSDHPRGGLRNRVFGYSAIAGAGELSREPGMLPGAPIVTPKMTGIAHGMVVPPRDQAAGGQLFTEAVAKILDLQGPKGTNEDVLKNLIKRITGLGYGKENTTGSEQEYVKQLEDIAALLTKLYEEKIPLAIHNQQVSDLSALGKEFAHYGITAPTAGQFKDANLLVETQSMGKMLGGYMKDLGGKVSLSVGKIYELFTGKAMGTELIPPAGNVPKLADASAVAHDPTIDTAATLVNAATMRAAAGQAGVTQTGLLGKKIELLNATWQKVSDAIWGARKFGSPGQKGNVGGMTTGDPNELGSFKRQAATHGGQLQPAYGPQQASTPIPVVVPVAPAQDPQQAAQEAGDAAARQAKALDALEKEKARIRKLKAQVEFQYQVDLVEQDMSVLKNLQAELNKPINQGEVQKKQLVADMAKLQATIDKKLAESSDVADGIRRQLDANGGVRTLFRAKKGKVAKSDTQKQLEKEVKDAQKEIDAQLGAQPAAAATSKRGPNSVIAAPLAQLQAAEQRIQESLTNAVSNSLGPALVSRLEQELAYVQKSIKTGPVGKRRMRGADGNLTSAEVDVFAAEGVRGAKDRVAGKSKIASIKKGLLEELKIAEEKGRTETVEAVSKLISELDASIASGPVGKYKNGRDAFELPDTYRQKAKQEKVVLSKIGDAKTPGAYDNMTHKNWIDQELEGEAQRRKAASDAIKGQMKGEMTVMAQVEKYNRKMMDSWISGRYALYDVANTYQQFQRVLMSVGREFQKAVQTFASYETSFTSVERAMQPLPDEFAGMRNEIVKLTGELPVAFDELSKITTLGAQMGIKADGITNFTEQVTKFSTITGLASDTVAQKFGRISQLAKVPSEDFNKLGSAVAFAGVNAVATDEEILTLTENIAAAASNSGFTADKIVGLATAMSSLGIAPEQARGVITRLFGDINRAVEGGGAPLNAFAKQLGMSAEGARELWKSDPQMFFKQMLDGLKGSKNMTGALDALNIKETREVSTLQKLAGNMEVYNQAMADAEESYANGSFLSDAYGKTQDNLATKMELLNNQLKMLQDSFGAALAPAVSVAVDMLNSLITGMNEWSKNPMAKVAMQIITGIAGLVAVMVTYKMVSMKATAATLAFRTAQVSLSKISGQDAGINGFRKMLMGQEQLIIRSNGRIEVASKKRIKEMEAAGEIKVAARGSDKDIALRAGADARRAGLDSTQGIIDQKNGMAQATLTSNQDTIATIGNTEAKAANTVATEANAGAAITESEAKTASSIATQQEIAVTAEQIAIKRAALVLLENDILVKEASISATNGNTIATEASIAASRAEAAAIGGEIIALEAKQAALAGTNVAQAEDVALMTAGESITNKWGGAITKLTLAFGAISVVLMAVSAISSYLEGLKVNLEEAGGGLASFREAIYKDTTAWKDGADAIGAYESKVTTQQKQIKTWADSMQNATGSVVELDDKVSDVTDSVKAQTLALGENSKEWLAQAIMKDDVVQKKFESWFDKGLDLDQLAQQANVKITDMIGMALADPGKGAKDYLSAWFADGLIPPEYRDQLYADLNDIAMQLDSTTEAGLKNTKIWKALRGATGAAGDGLDDLNGNLDNTIKKVYTLTDYVGDLSSIVGAAFTIRYGATEAIDKMETSWKGVAERLSEAKKQMEAINQEISAMTADKNILEYQLNIALKYGDTLRADKIRADIAAKTSEITNKQAEYNKAAQDASTGLTGMSPGAIGNRETMRGLVGDYNAELTALANKYSTFTGKNQKADRAAIKAKADALKQEFRDKAVGLGFAENELAPYIKSFEDFKTIVNKLPNTLTLKVVADPGTRAFMEWWAKSSDNPSNSSKSDPAALGSDKKKPKGKSGQILGYDPSTTPNEDLMPVKRKSTAEQQAKGFTYDVGNAGMQGVNMLVQPLNFLASALTPSTWNGESSYWDNVQNNFLAGTGGTRDNIWGDPMASMTGDKKAKTNFSGFDQSYQDSDYTARKAAWDKKHKLPTGYKEKDRAGLAAKHKKMYPGHYNPFDGTVNPMKTSMVVLDYGKPLADLASVHAARNPGKYNPYTQTVNPSKLSAAQQKAASVWKDAKSLTQMGKEHEKLYPGEYNPYTHSVNAGVIDIGKSDNKQFADYLQHGAKAADPMYVKNVNDILHKDAKNSPNNGWGGLNKGWSLKGYDQSGNAVYDYEKKYMGGIVGKYAGGGLIPGNAPANKKIDNLLADGPTGTLAVRSGEYIQNQQAVKYYGVDFMNAINKMQMPRLTYANRSSGAASAGNIVVELSPNAVMQLMSMSNRPINLYSDDRQIASSANRGNRLLAMRGSN
jgi:TP901 family phage tail tape measure protein